MLLSDIDFTTERFLPPPSPTVKRVTQHQQYMCDVWIPLRAIPDRAAMAIRSLCAQPSVVWIDLLRRPASVIIPARSIASVVVAQRRVLSMHRLLFSDTLLTYTAICMTLYPWRRRYS